jgi:MFS family permease
VDWIRRYVGTFTGFEPEARLFLVTALLAGAAISLYWIDFNLYLAALGLPLPTIGLIATVASISSALVAFPASMLSDRIGRRWVLIGGLGLMTLAFGGFVFVSGPIAIALLVILSAAGQQIFFVIQTPFLTERSRPEHRSELFALVFAIENITNVVAAIVGGLIAQAIATAGGLDPAGPEAFRIILVLMTVITAIAFVSMFRLTNDHPKASHIGHDDRVAARLARERSRAGRRFGFAVHDRTTFVRLLIPGFLISIGAGQIIPFLNLFIEGKFGLDLAQLNVVFAITSLGTVVAILLQPAIARRLGKVASVVLVQGLSIPFLLVLGFSPILGTVIVAMAVRNSLMNAGNPVANAFAMEQVRPEERATLSAAMSVLWSVGWVIAGPYFSILQASLGFTVGYAVNFITIITLYSVATALYWIWFHDAERRPVTAPVATT